MQQSLQSLLLSRRWEAFIVVLIVVNAVILGLMTSSRAMAAAGPLLELLDGAILAVFTVEIALRIFAFRARFFKDPWSLFDFFVVAIALMPTTESFSVLRAFRILRVMRLISVIPTLRRVVGGLIAALPGMASIVLLMVIIFYIFSVMATSLYGGTFPDWFGSIGSSAYTLFQIMTLESWSMGIVRPVMEAYPNAWVFFVPFIMVTAFAVLNLFIGIIVSGMQQEVEQEAAASRDALLEEQTHVAHDVKALRDEVRELTAAIERLTAAKGTS
ncbi:voltage-gated sodium channel [Acuticoccus sediminis]|uniref:Voltage-gated sodium channel n=1 Tax=Acuticoccus sediminis TaxID=2184697 RepID=A0A8B2NY22_9HYPH|nr:ion transporter [Acuticoccus sediminis]RAI03600.1 voltage-gated sodium channel [Acuticoccus sediminis]